MSETASVVADRIEHAFCFFDWHREAEANQTFTNDFVRVQAPQGILCFML